MKRTTLAIMAAVMLLVIIAAIVTDSRWGWWGRAFPSLFGPEQPRLGGQAEPGAPAVLVASGAIEARTIAVSSQVAGRLAAVHVVEGSQVAAGDLIAELDTTLLDAEIALARAGVSQAEAQVALLAAGGRPVDVAVAQAALSQAQAASAAAYIAWQDALTLITATQELDVKIAGAGAALEVAQEQLAAAQASATAADLEAELWARTVRLLEQGFDVRPPSPGNPIVHVDAPPDQLSQARLQWNLASQRQWQAHAQAGIAAVAVASAHQTLADLRAQRANPQSLQAQANAVEWAYRIAEAVVVAAQADLELARNPVQPERIAAAEALAEQAREGLTAAQVKADQARIIAPAAGVATAVVQRSGEVVAAGSPIVRLADLSQLTLSVYVLEPDLGRVRLGQAVRVTVDSFAGRAFPGAVTQIASQAEFTPKNVETRQDRVNTVFEVKIALAPGRAGGPDVPDAALKPGMPASAHFCADGAAACPDATGGEAGASRPALPAALGRLMGSPPTTDEPIRASGTVRGIETSINAELSGQVVEAAAEGARLAAGQVAIRLASRELESSYRQALAAVDAARAELARATAAAQPARVAQARAQVGQAEAALAAARSAVDDARRILANPQDLDAQINTAWAQAQAAAGQIDLAAANLKTARVLQESLPAGVGSDQDKTTRAIYDQQVIAAEAALRAAQAQQRGAQATLAQLEAIRRQPVALAAAVHKAEGQALVAEAALATAQAALAQITAPPQPEAVTVARARVAQAEAGAALLRATLDRLSVRSPITGTVVAQMIHVGEVARPAAALLTLVNLQQVKLVIYVPATRIGQVKLGQRATVTVDAYPGRLFAGVVTHINDQAEFTPKNIQTEEERAKMVFGVEISLENPDGALKPGMPADAALERSTPAPGS